jgi:hypothetical protein
VLVRRRQPGARPGGNCPWSGCFCMRWKLPSSGSSGTAATGAVCALPAHPPTRPRPEELERRAPRLSSGSASHSRSRDPVAAATDASRACDRAGALRQHRQPHDQGVDHP